LDASGVPLDVGPVLALVGRHPAVAIIGPHGTGKSTLLAAIATHLGEAGRPLATHRLLRRRDGIEVLRAILHARPGAILLLDGWERLGPLAGGLARLTARLRGCRLVVTSHRAAGMRTAVTTAGTLPLLTAIVARLPAHDDLITSADLADAFTRHRGNLRDALGDLYDRFEQRVRRP
jgi:energy-coupling factor transporter ATP-binding protein EcfA2